MDRIWYKFLLALALNVAVLTMGGDIKAAEVTCKGLDQAACQANGACSWVKAHKAASGKEIAAFCRKKPEKKAEKKPAATAPVAVTAPAANTAPAPAPAATPSPAPKQ